MSADVDNILSLCATCHIGGFWKNSKNKSWHEDIIYFTDWFKARYPERAAELKIRSQASQQADLFYWTNKWNELNKIAQEIGL